MCCVDKRMVFLLQELKKAILDDMVRLGKSSGLHSFEQVQYVWQNWPNHRRYNSHCNVLVSLVPMILFHFTQVKDIHIHKEMFSIQNGLLTPTLKAKRPELKEHFKTEIEQLYSSISMWWHQKTRTFLWHCTLIITSLFFLILKLAGTKYSQWAIGVKTKHELTRRESKLKSN